MSLTVTEAIAIGIVLRRLHARRLLAPDEEMPDDELLAGALATLAESASKRLQLTLARDEDLARGVEYLAAVDSAGAAQEVCRALLDHECHGGAIPWPRVRQPFEQWKVQRADR